MKYQIIITISIVTIALCYLVLTALNNYHRGDVYCLKVTITDKLGKPIKGAFVAITIPTPRGDRVSGTKRTDESGKVCFTLNYKEIRNEWAPILDKLKIKDLIAPIEIHVLILTKSGPLPLIGYTSPIDIKGKGPIFKEKIIKTNVLAEEVITPQKNWTGIYVYNKTEIGNYTGPIPLLYIRLDENDVKDMTIDLDKLCVFADYSIMFSENLVSSIEVKAGVAFKYKTESGAKWKYKILESGYIFYYEIPDIIHLRTITSNEYQSEILTYEGWIGIKGLVRAYNFSWISG